MKVEGSTDDIEELVRKYDIQQIVVAIPSSTPAERKRIYRVCTKTECVLKTLPNIRDLRIDELGDVALRDVDVTDLLGREEVQLDMRIAYAYVAGETVLVTGGGGSIGSELCRQLRKSRRAASSSSTSVRTMPTCSAKSCFAPMTTSRSTSRSAVSATRRA